MSYPPQEPPSNPALPQKALSRGAVRAEAQPAEKKDTVLGEEALRTTGQVLGNAPPAQRREAEFVVLEVATECQPGLKITIADETDTSAWVKVSANSVKIDAVVDAEVPPDEIGQWRIGFVQSVTFHRETWMQVLPPNQYSGKYYRLAADLDWTRDGLSSSYEPWYDPRSVKLVKKSPEALEVSLSDQPGFQTAIPRGCWFHQSRGEDMFVTWLIARKGDGAQTKFLHGWVWAIDWGSDKQEAGVEGIEEMPDDSGRGAILSGEVATDVKPHETWKGPFDQLPVPENG
jgi:hypothetical protein